ncbi:endonuclease VII domain-containing protein [Streptomyces paludis]|nr:endonuclease VII domain-containing protein [Streptomyces paludis]
MEKKCPKCAETKSTSDFHKDSGSKSGLCTYCKECNKAKARAWTKANPEKVKERGARRVWNGEPRAYQLRYKYGITVAEYDAMLASQGGVCAICGRPEAGRTGHRNLAVDHCHTSNQIRGLLCHSCNRALGLLQDSEEVLEKALRYIRRS